MLKKVQNKVLIVVSGGVVTSAYSNDPHIKVQVIDADDRITELTDNGTPCCQAAKIVDQKIKTVTYDMLQAAIRPV